MNALTIIRKSVISASVAVAVLATGAAFSAERLGRDSVHATATTASSNGPALANQRQGRSSVYAGDVYTSPRATVQPTPHIAGNGRGSVYAGNVYTSPRTTAKLTPNIAGNGRSSVFSWSNGGQS
jgi:hypothetical protein